jgi:hypothetical protein
MIGRITLGIGLTLGLILVAAGCAGEGEPTLIPNGDKALRKTSTEFAADAAKRNYEADAPKGEVADARAEFDLTYHKFDLANLSNADWSNVEVWVDQKFVLNVPVFAANSAETLDFDMFFDRDGHHFQTTRGKSPVESLQIYRDGKMYDVVAELE